jgi:hypothetical protein
LKIKAGILNICEYFHFHALWIIEFDIKAGLFSFDPPESLFLGCLPPEGQAFGCCQRARYSEQQPLI